MACQSSLLLSMQGPMTNLFIESDIWKSRMKRAHFDIFQCYHQMVEYKMMWLICQI